jgi:uncharacterized protein HemX
MAVDLDKKLDRLIDNLTKRNETVQTKKKEGSSTSWIVALVVALISLVGIGVAMWIAYRRGKELAKARTQIEQDKVKQDQRAHEIKKEPLLRKREEALEDLKKKEMEIQELNKELQDAEAAHAERKKKLENLRAWAELNKA